MSDPRAVIMCAPGTNRGGDAAFALQRAGAATNRVLIGEIFANPKILHEAQMLVVPGGYSFADALGAGRLFALELVTRLADELAAFVDAGKPVIGICNGFQVLVRTGLLPGGGRRIALGQNSPDSPARGRFLCEWVRLQPISKRSIWTAGLDAEIECPIAHGEGRVAGDDATLAGLEADDLVAFRYAGSNPNGSRNDIAGICDETGLVLGLMPHPEDHVLARQHPQHLRGHRGGLATALFAAGVSRARQT